MENVLRIKNKTFGVGQPLICVSVLEPDAEGIIREISRLAEAHVPMIEWRVDAFEAIEDVEALRGVLAEVKEAAAESILLFTFRSEDQGGLLELSEEKIKELNRIAAESHAVDLIDLEYNFNREIKDEIAWMHEHGMKVILSHHDFHGTPFYDGICDTLYDMMMMNADIVKMATMPLNAIDVANMIDATCSFRHEYPEQPLITMSMGKLGRVTRMAGEIFGSCVTFAAGKSASAPGQIGIEELQNILNIISSD